MATMLGTLFGLAILALAHGNEKKFTTQTNLEKLFFMESELMSLIDVFVREEHFEHDGEDVHNLTEIKTLTNGLKTLHKNTRNMSLYISHPINVLHLTRRFIYEWPEAIHTLQESEPCKTWKMPEIKRRLKNIRRNFPMKYDLRRVASSIGRIQYTQDLDLQKLFKGVILGRSAYNPVTKGDLEDIAYAAFESGQFLLTAKIAEHVVKECQNSKTKDGCDDVKLYKLAAGSYYKLNKLKEAVEMTELVLKYKPKDLAAQKNLNFYAKRLKEKRTMPKIYEFDIPNLKYYETCQGRRNMSTAKASRLYCKLLPSEWWLVFEKAEFHNIDPPIIEFHKTFKDMYITNIKNIGEKGFKKQAYDDIYNTPMYRQSLQPLHVYKVFSTRFTRLQGPLRFPLDVGAVEVRQAGMEGMYFKSRDRAMLPTLGAHIGSFFTFINDDFDGGEYVFPKFKVKIKPQKGNTIFFFATKSTLNICPVAFGIQWYVIQSIYEIRSNRFCRLHDQDFEEARG